MKTFGEQLKNLRIQKELTLRQCSEQIGVDPSNWSKFERGVNPAPKDIAILESWAAFFGLRGAAKQEFFDAAALSRRELPADIASDDKVLAALPAPEGFDTPRIVPSSAAIAILSLACAGIAAGLYPARQAALMQPVEALRQE